MKKIFCRNFSIFIGIFFLNISFLYPQDTIRQTIRGIVYDKQSQMPIPGATIVLRNFNPVMATTSQSDGSYRITGVPIGRIVAECSFLGYQPIVYDNIILTSGKELVLNFELEETAINLNEFVVRAYARKDRPVNRMAIISARSFTLEETGRYAGSYGDPARMAANYAGVMTGNDNRNDIVIRGNSSIGILWRLDGIEMSNPSHYAALGTTGGPITILNTNLLANSDFLSGAFPAQYGNALAGVFDLKLREGNNEKKEYWFQTGWNGLEFGAEGPFSEKSKASYIAAYRYSILEILNGIGVNLGIDPKYQDLNFKINMPYDKGKVNLIGIGGKSAIKIFDENKKQKDWMFDEAGENIDNSSSTGLIALSNLHFLNNKNRLVSSVAISGAEVASKIDTFSLVNSKPFTKAGEKSSEIRYNFNTCFKSNINVKNDIEIGVAYDIYDFSYSDSTFRNHQYVWDTDAKGILSFLRVYGQHQYNFSDKLMMVTGLNYQKLFFNNSWTIEPRTALKWNINSLHALNIGFGQHSQMQPRMFYFIQTQMPDGSYTQSNKNLDFSKSRHFVLGHDFLLSDFLRLKSEIYFQQLYNIPIKNTLGAYSAINSGVEYFVGREDSLINMGKGNNYGVEFTLERFFYNNYFFLGTASLFNSTFQGSDKIVRSTAFNTNYLINAVGGYEFKIGKNKNGALILGARFTWNGGRPYVPFDIDATTSSGTEVLDWENAYLVRHKDYKRISLRFGIRRNKPKYSSELVVDLQYRTHYTNIYTERIDIVSGKIHNYQKLSFYPLSTWKINF